MKCRVRVRDPQGKLIYQKVGHNTLTEEVGGNIAMFLATEEITGIPIWDGVYVYPVDNDGFTGFAVTDTKDAHPGWVLYTGADTDLAGLAMNVEAESATKTNAASPAVIEITSGGSVAGVAFYFISGIFAPIRESLWGYLPFGPINVSNGSTIEVIYTITAGVT